MENRKSNPLLQSSSTTTPLQGYPPAAPGHDRRGHFPESHNLLRPFKPHWFEYLDPVLPIDFGIEHAIDCENAQSCRLLQLPLEIRNMIYEHVIGNKDIVYSVIKCEAPPSAFDERLVDQIVDEDGATEDFRDQFAVDQNVDLVRLSSLTARNDMPYTPSKSRHLKYGLLLASKQLCADFRRHVYESVMFNFVTGCTITWDSKMWGASKTTFHQLRRCRLWKVEEVWTSKFEREPWTHGFAGSIVSLDLYKEMPSLRQLFLGTMIPVLDRPFQGFVCTRAKGVHLAAYVTADIKKYLRRRRQHDPPDIEIPPRIRGSEGQRYLWFFRDWLPTHSTPQPDSTG
ncbi:MAG: hypothetical protein M1831_005951 [Alyxoria varia]|nr:MAG: hypothetical protein M1831_005951 [Alyxoria varia]